MHHAGNNASLRSPCSCGRDGIRIHFDRADTGRGRVPGSGLTRTHLSTAPIPTPDTAATTHLCYPRRNHHARQRVGVHSIAIGQRDREAA